MNNVKGIATLASATLMLVASSMVTIFSAKSEVMSLKTNANEYRAQQALEAAEAGLEFGQQYLTKNTTTIAADADNDGNINSYSSSYTQNVVLASGTKYSITYANPSPGDYKLIRITAMGTSADGTSTKQLTQLYKYYPMTASLPNIPSTIKGTANIGGTHTTSNTTQDITIWSGKSVTFSGNGETQLSSGISSDKNSTGGDLRTNDTTLDNATSQELFENYFGDTNIEALATFQATSSTSSNYSTQLDGKEGIVIWINQTSGESTLNNNAIIGSPSNPVLLVVNGDLKINGGATIYGLVYSTGNIEMQGSSTIEGAVVTAGDFTTSSGTSEIIFNPDVLNKLSSSVGYYAKVPGSWNDMG